MLLFKSTATRTSLVGQAAYCSLADKRLKIHWQEMLFFFPARTTHEMLEFKNNTHKVTHNIQLGLSVFCAMSKTFLFQTIILMSYSKNFGSGLLSMNNWRHKKHKRNCIMIPTALQSSYSLGYTFFWGVCFSWTNSVVRAECYVKCM